MNEFVGFLVLSFLWVGGMAWARVLGVGGWVVGLGLGTVGLMVFLFLGGMLGIPLGVLVVGSFLVLAWGIGLLFYDISDSQSRGDGKEFGAGNWQFENLEGSDHTGKPPMPPSCLGSGFWDLKVWSAATPRAGRPCLSFSIGLGLTLVLVGFLLWYGMQWPLRGVPGVEIHGVKVKLFLQHGGVGWWFYGDAFYRELTNHYPPGFALLGAWVAWWQGGFDAGALKVLSVFYQVALLLMMQGLAWRLGGGLVSVLLIGHDNFP